MYTPAYFSEREFNQVGCSMRDMNETFLVMLDKARHVAGVPFFITSAFRTKEQNKRIGGAKNSAHLRGKAVDVLCSTASQRYKIVHAALSVGFTRIGIGDGFIHLDYDMELPQYVIWTY